jgi:hypothetical protein
MLRRAVIGLSLALLAGCHGHRASVASVQAPLSTAPGVSHPFAAGHLKDFSAADGAWVGSGAYLTNVSVLRLAATGRFDPTMLSVPASTELMVNAIPSQSDQFWLSSGPHKPNGSHFGLVAYTSEAPGIRNPPLLLKLPSPYAGYITCLSMRDLCLMTLNLPQGRVSMSLPPQALPNWRAIADGLLRAMRALES